MEAVTTQQLYCTKPRAMMAEQLCLWLTWHGLLTADIARACKVDRRTVYRWRKGTSSIPRTVWPRLAQLYGAPLPPFIGPDHSTGAA